jgi:hypothetical protein
MNILSITRAYCLESYEPVAYSCEYAALDNPDGAIFGHVYCVIAELSTGGRYIHDHRFDTKSCAQKLVDRINSKKLINLSHWTATYSVYGSPEWDYDEVERRLVLDNALTSNDLEKIEEYS